MHDAIDRRQFLARSSAAAVAAGLGSFGTVAAAGATSPGSPNDRIRAACIGLRGRGNHHMHGLESVPGVQVVGLCDVDASVLGARTAEL